MQMNQDTDAFKQIYRDGLRRSYFNAFEKKNVEKPEQIIDDSSVDEKTFQLTRDFVRQKHEQQFESKLQTRCWLNKPSFFGGCFGSRKIYEAKISDTILRIYSKGQLSQYIDFDIVKVSTKKSTEYFTLNIEGSDESIYIEPQLKHEQQKIEEVLKWNSYLEDILPKTQAIIKNYTYLPRHCPKFTKTPQILNSQFEKYANTGDILLFKSPHSAATIQRTFTNSEYDHVGVILRNAKHELFIFQSLGAEGVGLTPWKHMIKYEWYDDTEKICWRELKMKLNDQDLEIIEAFVGKTLGKGYQLSLGKLLLKQTTLNRTEEEQKNKTYFCSELAARLYKQLGILHPDVASSTYFPVDFSQVKNLSIIKPGVSLGHEYIISFDDLPKKK